MFMAKGRGLVVNILSNRKQPLGAACIRPAVNGVESDRRFYKRPIRAAPHPQPIFTVGAPGPSAVCWDSPPQVVQDTIELTGRCDPKADQVRVAQLAHRLQCRVAPVDRLAVRCFGREQHRCRRLAELQPGLCNQYRGVPVRNPQVWRALRSLLEHEFDDIPIGAFEQITCRKLALMPGGVLQRALIQP